MVNAKPQNISASMEATRQAWVEMYSKTLPQAAKARSKAQSVWPVSLDHCFARIILDNAVGRDSPWTAKLKSPAYKNMSEEQLCEATKLGQGILNGTEDLESLNRNSLDLRNKSGPKRSRIAEKTTSGKSAKKIKTDDTTAKHVDGEQSIADRVDGVKCTENVQEAGKDAVANGSEQVDSFMDKKEAATVKTKEDADFDISILEKTSDLTPFRRKVLQLLYTVPRGQWTTYKAMSDALTSSPRAVGNAMRNNPYAPMIPCHRVLASDGNIGGFGGDWGAEGRHAVQKVKLLREEGVRFDGKGKAVGKAYTFKT